MNQRQKNLLHQLLNGQLVTIKELATTHQASERTVRNDLVKIEAQLNESDYTFSLTKKPGLGLQLESPEQPQILKDLVLQSDQTVYETDERRQLILFRLLMATMPLTLNELADEMYTHKQVIRDDLKFLGNQLTKDQLAITIKPKIGIIVSGSERDKREVLSKTLKQLANPQAEPVLLQDFFSARELKVITELVADFEETHDLPNKGQPFNSIVIHVLFMVIRLKEKATIQLSNEEWNLIKHSRALELSEALTQELTQALGLAFPQAEVGYLALRIAAFYSALENPFHLPRSNQQIDGIIAALISDVYQIMGYDLSEDELLKTNLRLHLNATFTRIASGFHITNPLKEEILKNYTQLFLIVQSIGEEYAKEKEWAIPEEETAYLTVHLQGAIERIKELRQDAYKTVIVCNFGVGVSAFIEAKLTRMYPNIEVLGLLSVAESTTSPLLEKVDFLLTTLPLSETRCPVLEISPLFEAKDQALLSQFLQAQPAQTDWQDFDINRFTSPFLIQVQQIQQDQTEVIETMVENLLSRGLVTSHYLATVLTREAKSTTRVGGMIALPHGDPAEVKHSFIAIMTLKQPVLWQNDPVQLVALIGLKKSELGNPEAKKFFSLIHYLVETPSAFQAVLAEQNPLELLQRLSKYEG